MRRARQVTEVAPEWCEEIASNQQRQAEALGVSRKAIRAMREHGVISYPMTYSQYATLAPLFRGLGTTELLRIILAGIEKPRREKLIKTADMGQMEAYSYGYFIRFRLEHLHELRARCSYRTWREDMLTKFPRGSKWLMRKFYEKSRIQAKNAVQYALRKGDEAIEALAAQYGLRKRDYDGVWHNPSSERQKTARKEKARKERSKRLGLRREYTPMDSITEHQAIAATLKQLEEGGVKIVQE